MDGPARVTLPRDFTSQGLGFFLGKWQTALPPTHCREDQTRSRVHVEWPVLSTPRGVRAHFQVDFPGSAYSEAQLALACSRLSSPLRTHGP